MSKPISRLWFLGPPAAILLSIFVYYAKFARVRVWVDERFPWVAENVGSRLPPVIIEVERPPENRPPRPPADAPPPEPPPAPVDVFAPPPRPTFLTPDGKVEIDKLAANKPEWPKSVKLRKSAQFPAVVNGKVVGKIEVPAGAEATLVSIQQGKLGLEYQGGGAWLTIDETDLADRLRR